MSSRSSATRLVLLKNENGKRVESPRPSCTWRPRFGKFNSRSAEEAERALTNGKYTDPENIPGVGGSGGTFRNARSGTRIHCCPGGRFGGNPKTVFCQCKPLSCFTFFGSSTRMENDGVQRRRLRKVTLPITLRFAK